MDYQQLCVWHGCYLGDDTPQTFEAFMLERLGARVKFAEEVTTTGGRKDLLFFVNNEDVGSFAVRRLQYGIRWWEDVLDNGHGPDYPEATLNKYPYTWEKTCFDDDDWSE